MTVSGLGQMSILVFKTKKNQNQMVGFWPHELPREKKLENNGVRMTKYFHSVLSHVLDGLGVTLIDSI